jgi:hypothetical protein
MSFVEDLYRKSPEGQADEKAKQLQAIQDNQDVKTLLVLPEGRRFLKRLLHTCGVNQISYIPGDAYATAFKEGQRNIGLWLMSQFEPHPDLYLHLLIEKPHGHPLERNNP